MAIDLARPGVLINDSSEQAIESVVAKKKRVLTLNRRRERWLLMCPSSTLGQSSFSPSVILWSHASCAMMEKAAVGFAIVNRRSSMPDYFFPWFFLHQIDNHLSFVYIAVILTHPYRWQTIRSSARAQKIGKGKGKADKRGLSPVSHPSFSLPRSW